MRCTFSSIHFTIRDSEPLLSRLGLLAPLALFLGPSLGITCLDGRGGARLLVIIKVALACERRL